MSGKFTILIFSSIISFLGKTLRSGKSYQPRNESDKPVRRKKQSRPKNANSNPSLNQPQPNHDPPHPSPKLKATQNHPAQTTKSPEQTSSQAHHQSSPTTRQSHPTSPTGITASDVKNLWTDLKDPISYSGNSTKILNKIHSFQ